ncbi:hypothetical protein NP493_3147g00000 [Ridgeia piscesae]|uniref:Uncharacterized protein n=1 Tax=Ridgeia piscesae TaxID=27915 RepID=A0AAD9J9P0_RIDPI|nr:hypothetical protein NP493_3147g00000 [Ridgeia piscesae]
MSASASTCSEGVVSREDAPSETSDQLSLVLAGCLENLPPLSTRVVRIFISSTFTEVQDGCRRIRPHFSWGSRVDEKACLKQESRPVSLTVMSVTLM